MNFWETSALSIVTTIDLFSSIFLKACFFVILSHLQTVTLQAFPWQVGERVGFSVIILDSAASLLELSHEFNNRIMSRIPKSKKKIALISVVILIPSGYIQIVWFKVYGFSVMIDEQKEVKFLNYFPQFIENIVSLVLISFFGCIGSILISKITFRQPGTDLKIAGIVTASIAWLLLILDLSLILFSF
jgi:hypothetical protein